MPRYTIIFLLLISFAACKPRIFPPKPPGYFAIDTPAKHEYKEFNQAGFPYSFDYPVYSMIGNDTVFSKTGGEHPYWVNVNFPGLNGTINVTYVAIDAKHPLDSLLSDAWGLSFFHHEKWQGMDEVDWGNGHGAVGKIYVLSGNTASRYQFYATDSVKNFLRGSLYFDVTPNADSLKPATDFLIKDIQHMLFTLRWKTPQ